VKTSSFKTEYQRLNPEQKKAVDTTEGPVMTIAGPGTGKTQILALRIVNILTNPDLMMNPGNILCLTFTEAGALEMRERLARFLGEESASKININTFHGFCAGVRAEFSEEFRSAAIIDELAEAKLAHKLLKSLPGTSPLKPFGNNSFYKAEIFSKLSKLKQENMPADQLRAHTERFLEIFTENISLFKKFIELAFNKKPYARNINAQAEACFRFTQELMGNLQETQADFNFKQYFKFLFDENLLNNSEPKPSDFKASIKKLVDDYLSIVDKNIALSEIYKEYQKILIENDLLDFNDLIIEVLQLFNDKPEIKLTLQERYQYILVDEYQDTNGAQNAILNLLTDFHGIESNIFVVGDDDQAIYRFQGASVSNIKEFYDKYKANLTLVVLKSNYRSEQGILNVARTLINNNSEGLEKYIPEVDKSLIAANQALIYEKVKLSLCCDATKQAYLISKNVKNLLNQGTQATEIAILSRNNADLRFLAKVLEQFKIKYYNHAELNILDNIFIKQLVDLFKFLAKPHENSELLFNILQYGFMTRLAALSDFSLAKFKMIDSYKLSAEDSLYKRFKASASLRSLTNFIDYLIEKKTELSLGDFLEFLKEKLELEHYLEFEFNDYEQKINLKALETLYNKALCWQEDEKNTEKFTFDDLVNNLELMNSFNLAIKLDLSADIIDSVQLMTAHNSKGREFEYVFIYRCDKGNWDKDADKSKLKLTPALFEPKDYETKTARLEEQRRVFFVAITRAKLGLDISYSLNNKNLASDFINDILLAQQDVDVLDCKDLAFAEMRNHSGNVNKLKFERPSLKISSVDHKKVVNDTKIDKNLANNSYKNQISTDTNLSELTLNKEKLTTKQRARNFLYDTEVINDLLKNYRLSATHLNTFKDCARKFYYQHLLKAPQAPSKHLIYGTAVHEALFYYQTAKSSGKSFTVEDLINEFKTALLEQKTNLNSEEYEDCELKGELELSEYFQYYNQEDILPQKLEYKIADIQYENITLTGKLDRMQILADDKVLVTDYKTGKPDAAKKQELKPGGKLYRQLSFYALLLELAHVQKDSVYKMQSGCIDFIQTDSKGKFNRLKVDIDKQALAELKLEIDDMLSALFNHEFKLTEDEDNCRFCNFSNICWQ
jgi:DNA helicase-2/ATP-dependent DNA helicase PcrA